MHFAPNPPSVSVIIPAYGPSPHLEAVLEALTHGSDQAEEVFVSHSGDCDPTNRLKALFPSVTILHTAQRLFAGAARNRAAKLATSEVLAFCDNDTVPCPDWVEQIRQYFAEHRTILVGSVDVARDGGYWGMSTWLCEFSEQTPWQTKREQNGGASCNMAVCSKDLAKVGYFPEGFRAGQDTMVLNSLRSSGLIQMFEPAIRVGHFNIPGFAQFRTHLFNQGRHFSKVRKSVPMAGHQAVRFWPLAPALGIAKGALVLRRLASRKKPMDFVYRLPGIILGIAIWTAGCTYAAATGRFTGKY
ncbi:hypothetical protein GCM10023115_22600 [Pontixanthobacter gangjinensis]